MISIKEVEKIHKVLIIQFGGSEGIRDANALNSALARPYQTYAGIDLYKTPIQQAAALFESILINHPFIDGNKRIGYVLLRMFLIENKMDFTANENDRYDFVIKVASGEFKFDEIITWLQNNTSAI